MLGFLEVSSVVVCLVLEHASLCVALRLETESERVLVLSATTDNGLGLSRMRPLGSVQLFD